MTLAPELHHDGPPCWSPDSKRVAFPIGTRDGAREFRTVNRDGSDLQELADHPMPMPALHGPAPRWLPHGKIVYMTTSGYFCAMNPDGTAATMIGDVPERIPGSSPP